MNRLRSAALVLCATAIAATSALVFMPKLGAESASLSITPRKNYVIEPGKSINDTLTIRNLDRGSSLNITLRVVDFTYRDDGGTPNLMLEEGAPQTVESLRPFLTLPERVPTHWSAGGTPDGWSSRTSALAVATAIPLLLFASAASKLPLVTVGMLQYIAPIGQFLIGWLVFHEPMPRGRWIGFGLVWVAVALFATSSLLTWRYRRRRPAGSSTG